jgi:glyoxylase-like metal-dependent hydrolase (beta-lactamase superfamily II)
MVPSRSWSALAILGATLIASAGLVKLAAQAPQGGAPKGGAPAAKATQTKAGAQAKQTQNFDNVEVHTLKVQGNVYMLVGAGGNMTVQVGDDGVLVVDTQFAPLSEKIYAAIQKISDKPIKYIVNTHYHPDHTGGNETLSKLGAPIVGGNLGAAAYQRGATIIAHENVLMRMQDAGIPMPGLPSTTYYTGQKEVFFNEEPVLVQFQKAAHTDGDSIVFFRRSDVISTGDIFTTTSYPVVDLEHGGNIQGIIAALNHILDLTIPKHEQEGGTYVIPGHGRLCDEHDVLEYRDMVTIVRDRVQYMIKKGMTLEQVKAAKPTLDYDPRYGSSSFWTPEMFVEAVYKSLATAK